MSIVINGSGTVTGLAVGGLPDGTVDAGTLATDSVVAAKLGTDAVTADALKSDAIAALDLPAGSVLQVVNVFTTTETTSSSTTYADIGLGATITPSSTSSKILVITSIPIRKRIQTSGSSNDGGAHLKLVRGSTDLKVIGQYIAWDNQNNWGQETPSMTWLDSPSTTSATVYKIQMHSSVASNYAYTCHDTSVATLLLMEIAG